MAGDDIGKIAGRWLRSKVTEWTTSDRRTREQADAAGDRAEQDAKDHAAEEAILTALPGLRRLKEQQEVQSAERDAERARARRAELASRPRAEVELHLAGTIAGSWSGTVPADVHVEAPVADDGGDEEDDDPDPDPYAHRSTLLVDLTALDGEEPRLGARRVASWRFQVPGYHGDGTYDLAAIADEREAAGASPDYVDWDLTFTDDDEEPLYFYAGAGPASVTVRDGGRRLEVSMSMSGASGDATASATITLG